MRTHAVTTYTIDEHPNKDAVIEWVRDNWHDLGEFTIQESIESLQAFADYFGADLDYSIGILPDRGEFVSMHLPDDIAKLSGVRLYKYIVNNYELSKDCPFTGVCYDEDLLQPIREFLKHPTNIDFNELIMDCGYSLLKSIHNEGEYIYSDDGIKDFLSGNEYEFTENGEFYY